MQYRLVSACAAPHAAETLHVICEYIGIYARNCDYVYNFMYTYQFENVLYLFEIGLHVFEIGFKVLEIGLHLFEIGFYLFEIGLYLLEFGPKKV